MATVITGSKNAVMDGHAYNDYIYTLLPAQIQPSVGLMQAGASVGMTGGMSPPPSNMNKLTDWLDSLTDYYYTITWDEETGTATVFLKRGAPHIIIGGTVAFMCVTKLVLMETTLEKMVKCMLTSIA